jgi:hypothetical protein
MNVRLNSHLHKCKIYYLNNKGRFTTAFYITKNGRNSFKCEILEEIDFEDKKELYKIERYYIENYECVNKSIPLQTRREHYLKNKDKLRDKRIKKYYLTGKW